MDVKAPHLAGSDKTMIVLSCQIWLGTDGPEPEQRQKDWQIFESILC
jgi:hypothetical protein